MKKQTITTLLLTIALTGHAQKIDFNFFGRSEAEGTAPGFTAWNTTTASLPGFPKQIVSDTLTVDGIRFIVQTVPTRRVRRWDAMEQDHRADQGQAHRRRHRDTRPRRRRQPPKLLGPSGELEVIIEGLSAGPHTLLAYHNNPTSYQGPASMSMSMA